MATTKHAHRAVGVAAGIVGAIAKETDDYTMGAQQQLLLLALYLHGDLNQVDLPKYTGVQKSANGRNLARLGPGQFVMRGAPGKEDKVFRKGLGLVETYSPATDRRINLVRLTPAGRDLIERAAHQVAPYFGD